MSVTREEYQEYLQSEEWWQRRGRVFERAKGVCEGCREDEPVDVHHLSYEHVTQEFLFELVALCAPCHARIHGQAQAPAKKRQAWQRRKTESERWREKQRASWKRLSAAADHGRTGVDRGRMDTSGFDMDDE